MTSPSKSCVIPTEVKKKKRRKLPAKQSAPTPAGESPAPDATNDVTNEKAGEVPKAWYKLAAALFGVKFDGTKEKA